MIQGGISRDGCTDFDVLHRRTFAAQAYRDEILHTQVRLYSSAIGHGLILMDENARPHTVNDILQECITRFDCPARSPDLNPIQQVQVCFQPIRSIKEAPRILALSLSTSETPYCKPFLDTFRDHAPTSFTAMGHKFVTQAKAGFFSKFDKREVFDMATLYFIQFSNIIQLFSNV